VRAIPIEDFLHAKLASGGDGFVEHCIRDQQLEFGIEDIVEPLGDGERAQRRGVRDDEPHLNRRDASEAGECFARDIEGLNNKMRVIQRRAYGLRDEEYLKFKILTANLPE
jgi:hypothetical protein